MFRTKLPTRTGPKTTEIIRQMPEIERTVSTVIPSAGRVSPLEMTPGEVRAFEVQTDALFDNIAPKPGAPKSVTAISSAELQALMPPPRKLGRMFLRGVTQFFRSLAEPLINGAKTFAVGNQFGLFFPGGGDGDGNDKKPHVSIRNIARGIATSLRESLKTERMYALSLLHLARIIGEEFQGDASALAKPEFLEATYFIEGQRTTGAQILRQFLELKATRSADMADKELADGIGNGAVEPELFDHHGGIEELIAAIIPETPPQPLTVILQRQNLERITLLMQEHHLLMNIIRSYVRGYYEESGHNVTFDTFVGRQSEPGSVEQHVLPFTSLELLVNYLENQLPIYQRSMYLDLAKPARDRGETTDIFTLTGISPEEAFRLMMLEIGPVKPARPVARKIGGPRLRLINGDGQGDTAPPDQIFYTREGAEDILRSILHRYFSHAIRQINFMEILKPSFMKRGYLTGSDGSSATGWDVVRWLAVHQAIERDPSFKGASEEAVTIVGGPHAILMQYLSDPTFVASIYHKLDLEVAKHGGKYRVIEVTNRIADIVRSELNRDLNRLSSPDFLNAQYEFKGQLYTGKELLAMRSAFAHAESGLYVGHLRGNPDAVLALKGLGQEIEELGKDRAVINGLAPFADVRTMLRDWQNIQALSAGKAGTLITIRPPEIASMTIWMIDSVYNLPNTNNFVDLEKPTFLEDRFIFPHSTDNFNGTGRDILQLWAYTTVQQVGDAQWDEIKYLPINDGASKAVELLGGEAVVQRRFVTAVGSLGVD